MLKDTTSEKLPHKLIEDIIILITKDRLRARTQKEFRVTIGKMTIQEKEREETPPTDQRKRSSSKQVWEMVSNLISDKGNTK